MGSCCNSRVSVQRKIQPFCTLIKKKDVSPLVFEEKMAGRFRNNRQTVRFRPNSRLGWRVRFTFPLLRVLLMCCSDENVSLVSSVSCLLIPVRTHPVGFYYFLLCFGVLFSMYISLWVSCSSCANIRSSLQSLFTLVSPASFAFFAQWWQNSMDTSLLSTWRQTPPLITGAADFLALFAAGADAVERRSL